MISDTKTKKLIEKVGGCQIQNKPAEELTGIHFLTFTHDIS